jgi:hypothetical protein
MGAIIALFVFTTIFGVIIGVLLANSLEYGSQATSIICAGQVVVGISFIVAGNNRYGDGFGDLLELFLGALAIWSALMVGAGFGSARAKQVDEKRKSGDEHDHRP